MIRYRKFWRKLKASGLKQSDLISAGISHSTLQRIRNSQYIHTGAVDLLCTLLKCGPDDLMDIMEVPGDDICQAISIAEEKKNQSY